MDINEISTTDLPISMYAGTLLHIRREIEALQENREEILDMLQDRHDITVKQYRILCKIAYGT